MNLNTIQQLEKTMTAIMAAAVEQSKVGNRDMYDVNYAIGALAKRIKLEVEKIDGAEDSVVPLAF